MKEIVIKIDRKYEEGLEIILSLYGIDSYEIVDSELYKEFKSDEKNWDYIDKDLMKPSNYIEFKCYVESMESLTKYIADNIDFPYKIFYREIKDEDYANDWKKYFKPIIVTENLIVEPKWDVKNANSIAINPGLAFGTGSHETTFLMLKEIDKLKPQGKVLDVGTGSGILAIAAAKYFNCTVDAYEIDEMAIKSAKENLDLNNVSEKVNLYKKDFRIDEIVKYNYIFSNIYAETLVDMMDGFSKRIFTNGTIFLSGILESREKIVREAMINNNFEIISQENMNEWVRITGVYRG